MFSTSYFHPIVVHFSIAIVIVGFLTDVLGIYLKKEAWLLKAGFYMMILGTIAAVVGYLTGEYFTDELTGAAGELKERHELFSKITMWVLIVGSCIRVYLQYKKFEESSLKWIVFILYAIAVVLIGITGYLGGSLVYDYMIKI